MANGIRIAQVVCGAAAAAALLAALGAPAEEIKPADLVQPAALAPRVAAEAPHKPVVLHVGFNALYRSKHIPGAQYAGPGNKPDGLEALQRAVEKLPRQTEIVVYCGCCPWEKCPNVRPAMALLKKMGFTRAKALMLPTNFAQDWLAQGYPFEKGTAAP